MLSTKKTKIVATLGPATSTPEVIKDMMIAGVNVFRINFSHADYDDVRQRIEMIRALNKELGYNTAILADLQGPKLRVGVMAEGRGSARRPYHLRNRRGFRRDQRACVYEL